MRVGAEEATGNINNFSTEKKSIPFFFLKSTVSPSFFMPMTELKLLRGWYLWPQHTDIITSPAHCMMTPGRDYLQVKGLQVWCFRDYERPALRDHPISKSVPPHLCPPSLLIPFPGLLLQRTYHYLKSSCWFTCCLPMGRWTLRTLRREKFCLS